MTKSLSPLTLALCVGCLLLGSAGGAVAGAKITGKQIKNESVTGKDVKNGSLSAQDLAPGTVSGPAGPAGATGAQGPKGNNGTNGTNGAPGADGTDGVLGYQTSFAEDTTPSNGVLSTSKSCTGGRKLLGAFGYLTTAIHPVNVVWDSDTTASAFADSPPANSTLRLRIICATTS